MGRLVKNVTLGLRELEFLATLPGETMSERIRMLIAPDLGNEAAHPGPFPRAAEGGRRLSVEVPQEAIDAIARRCGGADFGAYVRALLAEKLALKPRRAAVTKPAVQKPIAPPVAANSPTPQPRPRPVAQVHQPSTAAIVARLQRPVAALREAAPATPRPTPPVPKPPAPRAVNTVEDLLALLMSNPPQTCGPFAFGNLQIYAHPEPGQEEREQLYAGADQVAAHTVDRTEVPRYRRPSKVALFAESRLAIGPLLARFLNHMDRQAASRGLKLDVQLALLRWPEALIVYAYSTETAVLARAL